MKHHTYYILGLFAICYLPFASVHAFDRSNVPLKPWGGFAVYRGWIYDALERLVMAGLTDKVVLNTKPLSRVEAARIIGQAVKRIQSDQYGDYNHRGYLEETLYKLVEEFGPELSEMGVKTPLNQETPPDFFGFEPLDHAEIGTDFSTRSFGLINDFGGTVDKGPNGHVSFDGRVNVGDYLSFYYQPAFTLTEESAAGKLLNGYGKFTLWNVEVLAGRESLWWGPGFRGSMALSNNAFPLDQVRVGTAEPFVLPWIFRHIGAIKLSSFVARLDEDRDAPHALLSGLRVNIAPSRFLELGFNRMFQFGGEGVADPSVSQFLSLFFFKRGCDTVDPTDPLCVNNVLSLDATLRLPDIAKYIFIARDASLYGEFGWDDTQGNDIVPRKPGGLVGIYLAGVLGDPKMDLRLEVAKTSDIQFVHSTYTSGFTNRGSVLSHFIGNDGSDIYARVSRWITPDFLLGIQANRSEIGSTQASLAGAPTEKRYGFAFDASYRASKNSSVFFGFDFTRVDDRKFVSGKSGNDFLVRFDFTQSFEW